MLCQVCQSQSYRNSHPGCLCPTNCCCFIDNPLPDDTKDYQTKSYREKVKLKAVSCSAVII